MPVGLPQIGQVAGEQVVEQVGRRTAAPQRLAQEDCRARFTGRQVLDCTHDGIGVAQLELAQEAGGVLGGTDQHPFAGTRQGDGEEAPFTLRCRRTSGRE